ncbi:hypothetical protein FAM8407_00526 [Lacticaseibacillus paracasei]|uniref:hypothetical protein n=1 Tax=Lacticaseibacillus paracasei TaxID=1597 RepID=UPI000FEEA907|nr:hypothetical protein [Lacticaseibacillus paracasei]RNE47515.1 hypothetical protein FAM8407_00526 [Lacticaseibacillus paracasei]
MNNNDDDFRDNVEYMTQGEQPSGQILTPKAVIGASEDLREYRQLINSKLVQRGCDNWLISIQCDLNVGKNVNGPDKNCTVLPNAYGCHLNSRIIRSFISV